jgi:hypothetical protein
MKTYEELTAYIDECVERKERQVAAVHEVESHLAGLWMAFGCGMAGQLAIQERQLAGQRPATFASLNLRGQSYSVQIAIQALGDSRVGIAVGDDSHSFEVDTSNADATKERLHAEFRDAFKRAIAKRVGVVS